MDDIDYGAVFGVETGPTGAEVTEPAAPAEGEEKNLPDDVKIEVKTEEDARFAAARRKAETERDNAIARVRQEAQEEARKTIDQFFANSGLINPYTRQPIRSKAEYDAYRDRYQAERKQEMMQKSGMSPEEYQTFVNDLPEVRAARQAREEAEREARAAREREARAKVDEQLKEIQAMDPSIRELKDLARMETYPKLYDMVRRGYSISDAYRLANYEALTSKASEASKQAAITAAKSKEHLSSTKPRGSGAVSVPADIKAEYRMLNPDATDEEIQKHYQKYMNK